MQGTWRLDEGRQRAVVWLYVLVTYVVCVHGCEYMRVSCVHTHPVILLFMPPTSVHGTKNIFRGVALMTITFVLCSVPCHEQIIIYPLLPLAYFTPRHVSPDK